MNHYISRLSIAIAVAIIIFHILLVSTSAQTNAAPIPNDPLLSEQWGWFRINADEACNTEYQGAGVVVALLDTGIDTTHPDLLANIVGGWNFVDNNNNVTDVDGHGTMVAGIVAAITNNSIGIAGVAPRVCIMPLKVLSESGGSYTDINAAVRYAADNGAKIIGMSLGGSYSRLSQSMEAAIDYAYRKGCILIAGAGNDNSNEPFYPAFYEQVIAVSATDQMDEKASFSNYGDYIDFCAPGVNIISTWKGATYAYGDGTSFSTPFVTGVVALILSKYPTLSSEDIVAELRSQVKDLGVEGWDPYFGWGLVDAYAAVTPDPIPEFSGAATFFIIVSITTMILVLKECGCLRAKLSNSSCQPRSG